MRKCPTLSNFPWQGKLQKQKETNFIETTMEKNPIFFWFAEINSLIQYLICRNNLSSLFLQVVHILKFISSPEYNYFAFFSPPGHYLKEKLALQWCVSYTRADTMCYVPIHLLLSAHFRSNILSAHAPTYYNYIMIIYVLYY